MSGDPDESLRFQNPDADRRLAEADSLRQYAPQLLRYPVRGYALGVVIVVGILFTLSLRAGIFGIAMDALLAAATCFYLLEVVGDTMTGRARPPVLGTEFFSEIEFGAIALMLVYLIGLILIPTYLGEFHRNAATLWLSRIMLFLFPAFIALLATEEHFWNALNPLKLGVFILQMGWAYLLVCLIMVASLWAARILGAHLLGVLPLMLFLYCAILACHTLGFVAYHRQEQLGLSVAVEKPTENTRKIAEREAALKRLLNRVDRLVAARNARAAAPLILTPAEEPVEPQYFYQELFEALHRRRDWALMLITGTRLIAVLAQHKHYKHALDIYEQCLDVTPQFEPRDANLALTLAQVALQSKRFTLFEKIAGGISVRHSGTELTTSLQFLRARYLAEFKKDDVGAIALLDPLLAEKNHPWHARIHGLHVALSGTPMPGKNQT